ncbi:MAG: DUF6519 domain-containing protein [Chloroflexi bacterium]|nr:DUF6519 domain-containing protein [Chloroflexota bacterium]
MKGDFTRSTFKPAKHYSSVRMQQGRVQLDADWNEQIDLTAHRVETETGDVIGICGAPLHAAGFALSNGAPPLIGAGRYYVDGILCENEQPLPLDQQPDLPGFTLPTDAGRYIAYLDLWQRHITTLEDGSIREVALGGPDTTTRVKTLWQVKLLGPLPAPLSCQDEPAAWQNLLLPKTGQMSARAQAAPPDPNACLVPPGAGFQRLENQLYRVEVHTAGNLGVATFKWSRDNGSIVTRWIDKKNDDLIVSNLGRDAVLGFAADQWVELSDDTRDLQGSAGTLVRLANAEGQALTIDPTTATGSVTLADFANNPKVRRWDSDGAPNVALDLTTNDGWLPLEDGVEIKFSAGFYNVGDYWLIPARTATGNVEWPQDTNTPPQPLPLPPAGIDHHFCRLAVVERDATGFTVVEDCRHLFPPLSEVSPLAYVSGDGQEAMPDLTQPATLTPLPNPLQVGVANRAGAQVRFQITQGNGRLQGTGNSVDLVTGSDGIASCPWELDAVTQVQQVEAHLLSAAGAPLPLPIRFNANLSVASQVAYNPAQCSNLAGITTVQAALDKLCQQHGGGCCITVGDGGDYARLDEALKDLLSKGESDLCLCLLHGEQTVGGLQIEQKFGERDLHIHIEGCGPGSRLILQEPWQFRGLQSLTLRALAIEAPFVTDKDQRVLNFEHCNEVTIAHCQFTGFTAEGRMDGNNFIVGGALLALANGDSVRLQNNTLIAALPDSLATPRKLFELAGQAVSLDILAKLFGLPQEGNFRQAEFRQGVFKAAQELAGLNADLRKKFQNALQQAISNTDVHPVLSLGESLSYFKLIFASNTPAQPDPQIIADIFFDIRTAAIKAHPGTAIILEKVRQLQEGDVNLAAFIETVDEDDATVIENNAIIGVLSLYGLPAPPALVSQIFIPAFLIKLRSQFKGQTGQAAVSISNGFFGTLQLRGNQIARLTVAQTIVQQIANKTTAGNYPFDVFGRVLCTDNVIEGSGNLAVAKHLTLASTEFTLAAAAGGTSLSTNTPLPIAITIADGAIFMGNHGAGSTTVLADISRISQNVANLDITIS